MLKIYENNKVTIRLWRCFAWGYLKTKYTNIVDMGWLQILIRK